MRPTIAFITLAWLLISTSHAGPIEKRVRAATISHIDFEDIGIADAIALVAHNINQGWLPPEESPALIPTDAAETQAERKRMYAGVYQAAKGKKITLRVENCSPIVLLTFLTDCIGLKWEFRRGKLVVLSGTGLIIAPKTGAEPPGGP